MAALSGSPEWEPGFFRGGGYFAPKIYIIFILISGNTSIFLAVVV